MTPTLVILAVGLAPHLLGAHAPNLSRLAARGAMRPLNTVTPAVTCTVQSTLATGLPPAGHGIVANGWYFRDLAEVWLWRQSNHLVQGEKVWEAARQRHPGFTTAQLFWWYNMYASVEYSVTPRPIYPADGRKIPALYSNPPALASRLENDLGPFPMFNFWGPAADIRSSQWIASCSQRVFDEFRPSLTLVYLPHLDYNLQRLGPDDPSIPQDVAAVDAAAGRLIDSARESGADVMVVSEYGIEPAEGHVHINRLLRRWDYLRVRNTLGWELLDAGASRAFAVADHQVAHIYIQDPAEVSKIRRELLATKGIAQVLDEEEKRAWGMAHERSGELVAIAEPGYWFTYYYWLEEHRKPDFATTVDIHRKPGYDPAELFIDPAIRFPKLKIGWRLLQKQLGFRMLMDVIPTDASLVKGTHGRLEEIPDKGPLLISSRKDLKMKRRDLAGIKQFIMDHFD